MLISDFGPDGYRHEIADCRLSLSPAIRNPRPTEHPYVISYLGISRSGGRNPRPTEHPYVISYLGISRSGGHNPQ
jgi:hypothetical protein